MPKNECSTVQGLMGKVGSKIFENWRSKKGVLWGGGGETPNANYDSYVILNICTNDTTLYFKYDQASDLRHEIAH